MDIFNILDLSYPGLEKVKEEYENNNIKEAKKEIKEYFSNRKTIIGFVDNKEFIRNYSNEKFNSEKEKIVKVSHEASNKEFIFTLPWEMERCYEKVVFENEINWSLNPFEDEEWTFMINRQRYLYLIAQSYLMTEDEKHIESFNYIINNWIDNNHLNKENKKTTWRTIEAGIRIKNWVKSLDILLESKKIHEELLCKILVSIHEHLKYLDENNKYERVLSNWVILEQQGAFMALNYFPELKISKELKEKNIKTLECAINIQVVEDGLHWEQSFQYHNEMLSCYLEILCLTKKNNIKISMDIKNKVFDMLMATLYIMKPNKCQSNYGDSDEEDLREILTLGALIFKQGLFKNYGYEEVDITTLMLYGEKSIEEYCSLQEKSVSKVSKAFVDSGLYFMRTGFEKNDSYSMFKCGFLGSGHGHSDTLHLEVSYKGEDILVDCGRYTYSQNNPIRIELKNPKSHNTTIVDNENFTICTSSWSNNGIATPIKGLNKFTQNYDFVEGGHLGYINTKGIFLNRKVIYIKHGIWVVSDEFFGNGKHEYSQFYNFNSKNVEKIKDNKIKYSGENIDFYIETINKSGSFTLEESKVSKNYNEIYNSKRAVFNSFGENNKFINTIMYGVDKNTSEIKNINYVDIYDWIGKKINSDVAEAIELKISDEEKYIVLLVHREDPKGRKMYLINNYRIYGRVVVIRESYGECQIEVLAY